MISIVIIVKNDKKIENTLKVLIPHLKSSHATEILVIDASDNKLDTIKKLFFNQIKWIKYYGGGVGRVTIPHQRNIGIRSASGDIIVFIDANCIPSVNWLHNITQPIIENKEKIVCGKTGSLGQSTIYDQAYKSIKSAYIDECATINLAIEKSVFKKIGNFDEYFEYGSDIDFTWRARDAGYNILYAPDAYIKHDWGNYKDDIRRNFVYGKARARLYKKHKLRRKNLLTKDVVALIYPIFIISLPISLFFPFYFTVLIVPILKNIDKKPILTTFNHLVYGLGVIVEIVAGPMYNKNKKILSVYCAISIIINTVFIIIYKRLWELIA